VGERGSLAPSSCIGWRSGTRGREEVWMLG
jgi:hypothetical protein